MNPLSDIEKKVQATGKHFFSRFVPHPRPLTLPVKRRFSFVQRWPLALSPILGALIVVLVVNATQPQSGLTTSLSPLKPLNTVTLPSWNVRETRQDLDYDSLRESVDTFFISHLDTFDRSKNLIYSPLSTYIAMSMLYEAADGTTRDELMNALSIQETATFHPQMRDVFIDLWIQKMNGSRPLAQSRLANGLFVKEGVDVENQFLTTLENTYFADVYHAPYDDSTQAAMAAWINARTNHFLDIKASDIDWTPQTVLTLLNTLYVRADWLVPFDASDHTETSFTRDDETVVDGITMMQKSIRNTSLRTARDWSMVTDDAHGDFRVHYVLPHEDASVATVLTSTVFPDLLDAARDASSSERVQLHVPKFTLKNKHDLAAKVSHLTPSLFDPINADLSKAFPDTYVESIVQHARFDVFEQGFEAAAVTESDVGTTAMPDQPQTSFILDRSFMVIVTNARGLLLFVGVVHEPTFA